jgi:two-component system phosphate regulon response regulator PhoB
MQRKDPVDPGPAPGRLLRYGVLELDFASLQVTVDGRPVALEGVLLKMLLVFARHPHHVLSRARLIEDVWGSHARRRDKTVDVAVCRLKARLGAAGEYLSSVRAFGYRFGPPKATGIARAGPHGGSDRGPGRTRRS